VEEFSVLVYLGVKKGGSDGAAGSGAQFNSLSVGIGCGGTTDCFARLSGGCDDGELLLVLPLVYELMSYVLIIGFSSLSNGTLLWVILELVVVVTEVVVLLRL